MARRSPSSILACGILAVLLQATIARAQPYTVDVVHSSVMFRVKHMNTSYAFGRFNDISGTVDLSDEDGMIDVQVAADSIDTAHEERDKHLRSREFFDVEKYPTIRFTSSKLSKLDDNHYEAEGELTLHGVTKPITVQLEKTGAGISLMGKKIVGVATEFKIKRSDYGMKYLVGPVGDEVTLYVSLECAAK